MVLDTLVRTRPAMVKEDDAVILSIHDALIGACCWFLEEEPQEPEQRFPVVGFVMAVERTLKRKKNEN